ncbi:MAG: hypothetical protein NT154_40805 [Verrucomicrobia bacterium]|nr:hypothetical protein [Verrucomicrobiota bacterium]
MSSLFSARAGVAVFGGGSFCRADWPLGKVALDTQALTLDALFRSYRLPLADIDARRRGLLTVQVEHHSHGIPPRVRIWGLRLFAGLRQAIDQHRLPVALKT